MINGEMNVRVRLEGDAASVLEQLELLGGKCCFETASVSVFTGKRDSFSPWFRLSTIDSHGADTARAQISQFERQLSSESLANLDETLNRLEALIG